MPSADTNTPGVLVGNTMMSHPFESIPEGKLENLNALQAQYRNDQTESKADLMVGVYRDDQGQPFVLPSVKMARQKLFEDPSWNHEYPSSHLGTEQFRKLSSSLFFGDQHELLKEGRIASMQCLGASGACHMGAKFLKLHYKPYETQSRKVYIPAETWANHPNVFRYVGFQEAPLPWYSPETHGLDIDALLQAIDHLPPQSVIVLQTSGNNPTGCDPTASEWTRLAQAFLAGRHFAFMDTAYPGFVTGDFEKDCAPIRLFANYKIPMLVAATFGKAFGLYGERVGLLCVTAPDQNVTRRIEGQMKLLARAETGAQPAFGAKIVEVILADETLRQIWRENVAEMAEQLRARRQQLLDELVRLETPGDWSFVMKQSGMFCFTGLSAAQINWLRERHHVYLQDTGRLSIAGLNQSNIKHVASSIEATLREIPSQG